MTAPARISVVEYRERYAGKSGGSAALATSNALGRLPQGTMNATEAGYARQLDLRVAAGEILWWQFEAIKIRVAKRCWYTPDFVVMLAGYRLEIHEVKGHWREDAKIKTKVAAEHLLVPFKIIRKVRSGWAEETFS